MALRRVRPSELHVGDILVYGNRRGRIVEIRSWQDRMLRLKARGVKLDDGSYIAAFYTGDVLTVER